MCERLYGAYFHILIITFHISIIIVPLKTNLYFSSNLHYFPNWPFYIFYILLNADIHYRNVKINSIYANYFWISMYLQRYFILSISCISYYWHLKLFTFFFLIKFKVLILSQVLYIRVYNRFINFYDFY